MRAMHARMAVVVLAAVTAACSSRPVALPEYPNEDDFRFLAGLRGTLELRDGCVVSVSSGETEIMLAWPSPWTVWDGEAGSVTVHNVTARLGDQVVFAAAEGKPSKWVTAPPENCAEKPTWRVSTMRLLSED